MALLGISSGSDYIDGLEAELLCSQTDNCSINDTRADESEEYFQGLYAGQELSTGIEGRPDAIKAIEELEDEEPERYLLLMNLILHAYP